MRLLLGILMAVLLAGSYLMVLCGGGGGSAGITSPTAGKVSLGGAGSGGGCATKRFASSTGGSITIGAGGTAGDNTGSAGGTGGTSTFSTLSAAGGAGGGCVCGATPPAFVGTTAGGTATGGDFNVIGSIGFVGHAPSTTLVLGAQGGGVNGGPGPNIATLAATNANAAGVAGANCGAGASGPVASGTGAALAGAAGANGCAIVYEYR